jgi:hypothetical protein
MVINGPETCDGSPPIGCYPLGFPLGDTACTGCEVDASACEYIGWQSDDLLGAVAHDIWGSTADDVWLCADVIHRWDGVSWNSVTNANCDLIWGFSSNDVYFASASVMRHFNGSTLEILAGPVGGELAGFWGTNGNDLYAALRYRTSGSSLSHWNGSTWSDVTFPGSAIDVWGESSGSIWAITDDDVLYFDGNEWESEAIGFPFAPQRISGCDGDVVVVGVRDYNASNPVSAIVRKRAGVWSVARDLPFKFLARDLYCSKSDEILIVGDRMSPPYGSAAIWFDGAIPFVLDTESQPQNAKAVWGSLHEGAFIAADYRYPHRASASWGASDYVSGKLWRAPRDLWSISGTTVYRNGSPSFEANTSLKGISGYGDDFVIVVGATSAWRRSGGAWEPLPAFPPWYSLTDVAACSANTAVALAGYALLRFSGSGWSPLPTPVETVYPTAIWCKDNDVVIIGRSSVQHFDGTDWTVLRTFSPNAPELTDVWATGPSDVFVVGDAGTALHWNGTSWRELVIGPVDDFRSVHGTRSNDVFMVTKHGTLYRWDGHFAYSLGGTLPFEPWGRDVDVAATQGAIYLSNSLSPGRVLVR